MQTIHQPLLILAVALLPLSTPAQSGKGPQNNGKGTPPTPSMLIERMDTDENGSLSRDEAGPRLAKRFDQIDADQDGAITEEELAAVHQKGQKIADMAKQKMKAADTDANGAISIDEAAAADMQKLVEHFDRLDSDGDGEISRTEMRQFHKEMRQRNKGNDSRRQGNP